jgi:2,4-dienoyl-CoA reductase (NADPH2)
MSIEYPILASPLQVNGVTLRNRMMTTSMSPGRGYVSEDNRPTARLLAYLEERAKGGTALITQTILPWKRAAGDGLCPLVSGYGEECLPDLHAMSDAVHKHGGLLAGQPYYVHDWKPSADEPESSWGPSDIAILKFMGGFKAMSLEQIEVFKQQFFNAAKILKEGGFDAVEVMAGVGGILSRFMALATNNRTDEYGGSLENRVKLTLEVIRGVREAVGPDFPIIVRWSPVDFIKSPAGPGLSMEESLQIAPLLEEAGADLHDLAVGWHETSVPLTTKAIEDGHWTYLSQQIKAVAKKPVAQGYRNTNPRIMEQNLREGKLDVIAGLRYSIADPELPNKVMNDRTWDMNLCICCCRCLNDVVSEEKPLNFCGVNPHLGEELDHELYQPAATKKNVMVIGSGPAGITAALTAAQRGHAVTLYEAGPRLGGCMKMSSIFSPYHERYLTYLGTQLTQHPEISVRLNTQVTQELVSMAKPDVAIVAVGGHPQGLDVPGADGKNVVSSHDFLEMLNGHAPKKPGIVNTFMWNAGSLFLRLYYTPSFARNITAKSPWPMGKSLAIIGGGLPGCELGHLMMGTNRTLSIIEERKKVGYDVGASDRFAVTSDFKKAENVELFPLTKVTEITAEGVKAVQQTPEGDKHVFLPAKTVAITLGLQENHDLGESLKPLVGEVYLVGDCNEPARIADATKAGYRAACTL